MTVKLIATWKSYDIGSVGGTLTPVAIPVNWTLPAGKYCTPFPISSSYCVVSSAVDILAQRLDEQVASPSYQYRCYYDNTINRVVLSSSIGNSGITFNAGAQRIFGFDASYGFWQVITASNAPYGIFESSQENRANDTDLFEETSFVEERLADSGKPYSIGRLGVAKFRNWDFINEPKRNVFDKYKESTQSSYTWEEFVKNVRKSADFFVVLNNVDKSLVTYEDREALYLFKEENTAFKPKQLFNDYIEHWNIPVRTRVFDPKHRDTRTYPPSGICHLPGQVSAVSPMDGEDFLYPPTVLSWSVDFDYGGSNPNEYSVFHQDNVAFVSPLTDTTSSSYELGVGEIGTEGTYYWRIDGSNQCGARVGEIFSYNVLNFASQSKLTDLQPYYFKSGAVGDAWYTSASFIDHTFEMYEPTGSREIGHKLGQGSNEWFIVESKVTNVLSSSNVQDFVVSGTLLSVTSSGLVNSSLYPWKAIACSIIQSRSAFVAPNSGSMKTGEAGQPHTFGIFVKSGSVGNTETMGIELKSTDVALYYDIRPATGGAGLSNGGASAGFDAAKFRSGSVSFFANELDEVWQYHWFKFNPNDYQSDMSLKIYPCAHTTSIGSTWAYPLIISAAQNKFFGPQLVYVSGSAVGEAIPLCVSLLPTTSSLTQTIGQQKEVENIETLFTSSYMASGSALKVNVVTSYSSSNSNVDRPIITFKSSSVSGSENWGLKLLQSGSVITDSASLRLQITTDSGSYVSSQSLGFRAGERLSFVVDDFYKRVDWYQSTIDDSLWQTNQQYFYFTGSWFSALNTNVKLGTSGSSPIAFDGLINLELTSSKALSGSTPPPDPPTGSIYSMPSGAWCLITASGTPGTYTGSIKNQGNGFDYINYWTLGNILIGNDSHGTYYHVSRSAFRATNVSGSGGSSEWTMVFVGSHDTLVGGRCLTDLRSTNNLIHGYQWTNQWGTWDSGTRMWGGNPGTGVMGSWIAVATGSNMRGYNKGVETAASPTARNSRVISNGQTVTFFTDFSGGDAGAFQGKLYLFAVYTSSLNATDRAQIDQYVSATFPGIYP